MFSLELIIPHYWSKTLLGILHNGPWVMIFSSVTGKIGPFYSPCVSLGDCFIKSSCIISHIFIWVNTLLSIIFYLPSEFLFCPWLCSTRWRTFDLLKWTMLSSHFRELTGSLPPWVVHSDLTWKLFKGFKIGGIFRLTICFLSSRVSVLCCLIPSCLKTLFYVLFFSS